MSETDTLTETGWAVRRIEDGQFFCSDNEDFEYWGPRVQAVIYDTHKEAFDVLDSLAEDVAFSHVETRAELDIVQLNRVTTATELPASGVRQE